MARLSVQQTLDMFSDIEDSNSELSDISDYGQSESDSSEMNDGDSDGSINSDQDSIDDSILNELDTDDHSDPESSSSDTPSRNQTTSSRARGTRRVRGGTGRGRGRGRGRGGGRSRTATERNTQPKYVWNIVGDGDVAPTHLPFTATAGVYVDASIQTPEECFSLFFNNNLWQFLVDRTNEYAAKKLSEMTISSHSLYKNWVVVSVDEMKVFIGVILNMDLIQLNSLKDYWSTDDLTDTPFFRSVFSRNRFFQIFGMLHVGDTNSQEKRAKIQPLIDILTESFQSVFTPSQHIAIDESVISFTGRVSFRQYLKGKPNPYGIKAFMLADSPTGYVTKVCVYYGNETQLVQSELPHTVRVILTQVDGMEDKGYDLYTDRFYTSPILAAELKKRGITVTGTVQSNRKGLPPLKEKKKPRKGTVKAFQCGDILVLSWTDKRQVLMLSTKHKVGMKQVKTRTPGVTKEKPNVVVDYKYMLGVYKMDQLVSYYAFLHKSVKWWRKVFFWMLEVTTVNSYIIYKEQAKSRGERYLSHVAYRRKIIETLTEPLRSNATPHLRTGPRLSQSLERLQPVQHFLQKGRKRRDCVVCSEKEEGGMRHLTAYECKTCGDNPALWPSPCLRPITQRSTISRPD